MRAVASEEFTPCGGIVDDRFTHCSERHVLRELRIESAVCDHRARIFIHLCADMLLRFLTVGAEQPLGVAGYLEAAHRGAIVRYREHADFERILSRQSDAQRRRNVVVLVLEYRVSRPVLHCVLRAFSDRLRRSCPDVTAVAVTDVDAITGRILDWIIVPWRQPVRAVGSPHRSTPALTDAESGCRIADDVDPRRWRKSLTSDSDLVFVPVIVSADSVEVSEAVTGNADVLAHFLSN